jgi:uncharacterized protein (DUF2336 family)
MAEFDADRLLAMARNRSQEGRAELADAISDLFEHQNNRLTDREKSLMYGILQHLVSDCERAVREIVSAQISGRSDVPTELARLLADDAIEVAYPILTRCEALKDEDLIEIIRNRAFEHQLAIALRYDVSERVAGELVATGDRDVIVTLLENANAQIAQSTLAYLVDESRRVDSFQQPILRRQELDPALARKMFMWVSAALRAYIVQRFKFDSKTLDDLFEAAGIAGTERTVLESRTVPVDHLSDELADEGLITADTLLGALRQRHVHLFVSLLVKATGLRRTLIMRFLLEPSGEGLAIACRSLEFEKFHFLEIFKLASKARPARAGVAPAPSDAVSALYDNMTRETAQKVVKYWRRDHDYTNALRIVEQAGHDAA